MEVTMKQVKKPLYVYEGRKRVSVILDIATYEDMIEQLEQLEDVRALEELDNQPEETISFEEYRQRRHAQV